MRSPLLRVAASAALLALPLTACGGGSSTSSSSSGGGIAADVTVHAKDTLKFDKSDYGAKAGTVSFAYVNDGSIVHTLLIDGKSGFKLQVNKQGETATGSTDLTAGTYTLYCDIVGHRAAGMEAKLTVG
jgi:plastocyanin